MAATDLTTPACLQGIDGATIDAWKAESPCTAEVRAHRALRAHRAPWSAQCPSAAAHASRYPVMELSESTLVPRSRALCDHRTLRRSKRWKIISARCCCGRTRSSSCCMTPSPCAELRAIASSSSCWAIGRRPSRWRHHFSICACCLRARRAWTHVTVSACGVVVELRGFEI